MEKDVLWYLNKERRSEVLWEVKYDVRRIEKLFVFNPIQNRDKIL